MALIVNMPKALVQTCHKQTTRIVICQSARTISIGGVSHISGRAEGGGSKWVRGGGTVSDLSCQSLRYFQCRNIIGSRTCRVHLWAYVKDCSMVQFRAFSDLRLIATSLCEKWLEISINMYLQMGKYRTKLVDWFMTPRISIVLVSLHLSWARNEPKTICIAPSLTAWPKGEKILI